MEKECLVVWQKGKAAVSKTEGYREVVLIQMFALKKYINKSIGCITKQNVSAITQVYKS